jgi:tight adherence protein G
MLINRYIFRKYNLLSIFIRNEKGAILLPFIILLPMLIGLIFLSFEISQYLQKKARLSDAIEQAALVLTVENNDAPETGSAQDNRNKELVSSYARAYLPAETFSDPNIEIAVNDHGLVSYNANITMNYPAKFLSQKVFANLDTQISVADNGSAIKHLSFTSEPTDVVFVVDYSGSMDEPFDRQSSKINKKSKMYELRKIFNKLQTNILKNDNIRIIGFTPFSWGTKIIQGKKEYCHFPFVPKENKPDGDYLRQYTASELKKFPEFENINGLEFVKYGELTTLENQPIYRKVLAQDRGGLGHDFRLKTTNISESKVIFDIIEENIDYDATIDSINRENKKINIPIKDVLNSEFCLKESNAFSLELDGKHNEEINNILNTYPAGNTLISSGILAGNDIFTKVTNNNNKLMIILSDGDDSPTRSITERLIGKGMCERIKQNNIRMVFIGIGYIPNEDINWEKCVGKDNFYLAHNAHELEMDIQQAFKGNDSQVGRNTPKR